MSIRAIRSSRTLLLSLALCATAAACAGGGGGGGGDDDDTPPPTPTRPGFVVARLQQTLSIVNAAGPASTLVDVVGAPIGVKTLVGFGAGDKVVYRVATSTSAGFTDLYSVGVDGGANTLLATGVTAEFGWADPSHLIIQKGNGPQQAGADNRDLYVVPVTGGGEVPLSNTATDEEFAGMANGKVVFRRITSLVPAEANLFSVDALGGNLVQLTTDVGPEVFGGFTASNRLVFNAAVVVTNSDVFSIKLDGTDRKTLADSPNAESSKAIQGERVVIQEIVPTMGGSEGNVFAVNSDGTSLDPLSSTADLPENFLALTAGGRALISLQTSFDPVLIDVISVPVAGGDPVVLGAIGGVTGGGLDAVLGETAVLHSGSPAEIVAIEADGSGARTLASGTADAIFRAATASRVIYGETDGANEKLWSVSIDGGNGTQLRPGDGADTFAAVLANIVVMSVAGPGGQSDLIAANTAGGDVRTLAGATDAEQFRFITPDGRVVFSRRRGAFLDDLYIVNADATGEIGLTERSDADVFLGFLP